MRTRRFYLKDRSFGIGMRRGNQTRWMCSSSLVEAVERHAVPRIGGAPVVVALAASSPPPASLSRVTLPVWLVLAVLAARTVRTQRLGCSPRLVAGTAARHSTQVVTVGAEVVGT